MVRDKTLLVGVLVVTVVLGVVTGGLLLRRGHSPLPDDGTTRVVPVVTAAPTPTVISTVEVEQLDMELAASGKPVHSMYPTPTPTPEVVAPTTTAPTPTPTSVPPTEAQEDVWEDWDEDAWEDWDDDAWEDWDDPWENEDDGWWRGGGWGPGDPGYGGGPRHPRR